MDIMGGFACTPSCFSGVMRITAERVSDVTKEAPYVVPGQPVPQPQIGRIAFAMDTINQDPIKRFHIDFQSQ